MQGQPLVSIVTPLYNEETHLSECIESILAQTYSNWDYTIVNNQSTDRSGAIAKHYAAKDSRIRVIDNQDFLRAYPNHNKALQQISPESKYCKIVFADDWIFPECIERMVQVAESHPSVGLVGAYVLEGTEVTCTGLSYEKSMIPGREILRRSFLERLYTFSSANSVLYRSDLVRSREPFFAENDIHADTDSCFALLQQCDMGFVHQVLTYTRVRPESLYAYANHFHAYFPSMLKYLQTYGAFCLTPAEQEAWARNHLSDYYTFLGKSVLMRRDKEFWNFHKTKMRECGEKLRSSRVAWGVLATMASIALSPRTSILKLLARRRAADIRLGSRFSVNQGELN